MAYIGQGIKQGTFKVLDTSGNTYNGSNTTFNLGTQVGSAAQLLVSHDGVIQKAGTDYTLATGGTQITFSTAPASGASIFITEISGAVGGTVTPSDTSVTADKLNSAVLTGLTDIGAGIADADLFLVDDGASGTLRKVAASRLSTYISPSSATDSFSITGSTPTLTIGDAGAEDTKIVFDGNAQDFHIGLDDSSDDLVIGLGSALGTTTHMAFDEIGAVTKPLQPSYLAVKNGNTNNVTGDGTNVVVGDSTHAVNEIYDKNGDFDTSNGTFTCPVTGRYLMSFNLFLDNVTDSVTDILLQLEASNRTVYCARDPHEGFRGSGGSYGLSANCILDGDANDTIKFKFTVSGTTKTVDLVDLTTIAVELLG